MRNGAKQMLAIVSSAIVYVISSWNCTIGWLLYILYIQ